MTPGDPDLGGGPDCGDRVVAQGDDDDGRWHVPNVLAEGGRVGAAGGDAAGLGITDWPHDHYSPSHASHATNSHRMRARRNSQVNQPSGRYHRRRASRMHPLPSPPGRRATAGRTAKSGTALPSSANCRQFASDAIGGRIDFQRKIIDLRCLRWSDASTMIVEGGHPKIVSRAVTCANVDIR
jgi:hypothetical protein